MSQNWISRHDQRWQMVCDMSGCPTALEPTRERRALLDLAADGWFIARRFGDACPMCVAEGRVTAQPEESLYPTLWIRRLEELRLARGGAS